jgi:hypothetical protein
MPKLAQVQNVDHKFFYAKLGIGNTLADDYLSGNSEINAPAIPIHFSKDDKCDNREAFLNNGGAKEQGTNFFWCGDHPDNAHIVIIHRGIFHLVKPCGAVVFRPSTISKTWRGQVKLLPIMKVIEESLDKIPPILATMTANRHLSSGTFREIKDEGCRKAIDALAFENRSVTYPNSIFSCLSSIELETMIAKLFEEVGCFVPAYRGGSTVGIDIFAHNDTSNPISIGRITIPPKESKSIQVKRHCDKTEPPDGCNYLLSVNHDTTWMKDAIARSPVTRKWVARSLSWLPKDYLKQNGL